jgi:enoyl-CoA hydratase/carnithine racemase
MSYQDIRIDVDGPVASLVLARPDTRNALTEPMGREIERAVGDLNARSDVRAVLLRGEGKAFSAGGDLGMIEARTRESAEDNRAGMLAFYRLFLSVRAIEVPTIAVLHGAARGAGVCVALACDLRVAAVDATLGLNFVRIGLHPGMGATHLLPRLVGPAHAAALLLTGGTIGAGEALRIGLVNSVHPEDRVLDEARALAARIAECAPIAVRQTKRSLQASPGRSLDEALAAEAEAQAVDYASADLAEGVRAAREKRAPRFSGR